MDIIPELIVTRHPALVTLLVERGIVQEGTPVVAHATIEEIEGKHVAGVLPLSLAVHAASVTEIPLKLEASDRGKELPISRLREVAGEVVVYLVERWA